MLNLSWSECKDGTYHIAQAKKSYKCLKINFNSFIFEVGIYQSQYVAAVVIQISNVQNHAILRTLHMYVIIRYW